MNIYIYIIFYFFFIFGRFSSSWNEKKKSAGTWNGLLPILVLSHDTMHCIVTGRVGRLAWAQPRGHDTTELARSKAYDTSIAGPRDG